eukprot:1145281-Pelagomonas_calceolata.AAC.6
MGKRAQREKRAVLLNVRWVGDSEAIETGWGGQHSASRQPVTLHGLHVLDSSGADKEPLEM